MVEREHVQLSHVANARWIDPGIVVAMYTRPAMAPAMCASWLTRPIRAVLAITL
jgi:hypothetical protein